MTEHFNPPSRRGACVSAGELQFQYEQAVPRHLAGSAAVTTVEAIMWIFRKCRTAALKEPNTQHRLQQMSDKQVIEIAKRLQKHPLDRPWSDREITELYIARANVVQRR
jgi:hypothetical protein